MTTSEVGSTARPQWFVDALALVPTTADLEVEGITIRTRSWGAENAPRVLLVHGGGAHAGWWDHLAPLLARSYRVTAIDLSGHGDSGRRDGYSLGVWAAEVVAVARRGRSSRPPVVIGHSMGGWVAMAAAADNDCFAGVAVIDTPLRSMSPEDLAAHDKRAFGSLKIYRTRHEGVAHFRTVPEQPDSLPYVIEHIAHESLRKVDGGWSWKFDPAVFGSARPTRDLLRAVSCRAAVFRAERGLVTDDIASDMYELFGRCAPVVELPLAGHHPMLDHPLSLVSALLTLLADWDHSIARIGDRLNCENLSPATN